MNFFLSALLSYETSCYLIRVITDPTTAAPPEG